MNTYYTLTDQIIFTHINLLFKTKHNRISIMNLAHENNEFRDNNIHKFTSANWSTNLT